MNVDKVLSQANLESLDCKIWLPLNGDVNDYSGNGYHGTANSIYYERMSNGKYCAVQDAQTDLIYNNQAGVDLSIAESDGFTFMLWFIEANTTGNTWAVGYHTPSSWSNYICISHEYTQDILRFQMSGSASDYVTSAVDDYGYHTDWRHYCLVKDGEDLIGYVDGQEVVTNNSPGINSTINPSQFSLSYFYSNAYDFNGKQSNALSFHRKFEPSQIRKFYNATYIE